MARPVYQESRLETPQVNRAIAPVSMDPDISPPQICPGTGKFVCCLFAKFLSGRQPDNEGVVSVFLVEQMAGGMGCDSGLSSPSRQMRDGSTLGRR